MENKPNLSGTSGSETLSRVRIGTLGSETLSRFGIGTLGSEALSRFRIGTSGSEALSQFRRVEHNCKISGYVLLSFFLVSLSGVSCVLQSFIAPLITQILQLDELRLIIEIL